MRRRVLLCILGALAACATPPLPVNASREQLWNRFGHQKVDALLMAWGTPAAETRLTDGSRMITYRHATTWDAESPYERTSGCEVTFLAQSPLYRIENIAMRGDARECERLARGEVGAVRHVYLPPPPAPYPYSHYPYYHPYWW